MTSRSKPRRRSRTNAELKAVARELGLIPGPRKLLALAVKIIEAEHESITQSYTERIGERTGKVTDYDARRWLREYNRFLKPARTYLGLKR
jgi:hypothetical protein